MAIEFNCPTCQAHIRVPDEAAGKNARCPRCQGVAKVPAGAAGNFPLASNPLSASVPPLASPSSSPPTTSPSNPADANPFTAPGSPLLKQPAAWLPPAGAFAPQSSQSPAAQSPAAFSPPVAPPGTSGNPFGELPTSANPVHSQPLNPYASPTGFAGSAPILTSDEVRGKLLLPALGMAITAVLTLVSLLGMAVMVLMDEEFHQDIAQDGQDAAIAAYVILAVMLFLFCVPSIVSLVGSVAMFRGQGKTAAWSGAIASLVPCSPCLLLGIPFAIWAMIVLSDSRVGNAM